MIEFILKGGPFMWPILLCSVIAVAVIIERFYFFNRAATNEKNLLTRVKKMISEGKTEDAERYAGSMPGPIAHMVGICIHISSRSQSEKDDIISQAGSNEMRKLEKNLRTLGIIAHITPLLGLLGTVTGMISAFMKIQELEGRVDASVLAGGIWEALITTASGLTVAIPVMVAYHYFEGRADDIYARMKNAAQALRELFGCSTENIIRTDNAVKRDVEYGV